MKRISVVVLWLFACVTQAAELSIEITRGADNPTSIAVVPLGATPGLLPPTVPHVTYDEPNAPVTS